MKLRMSLRAVEGSAVVEARFRNDFRGDKAVAFRG
jgi:hypothetical protein